jgi:hypothetical protein
MEGQYSLLESEMTTKVVAYSIYMKLLIEQSGTIFMFSRRTVLLCHLQSTIGITPRKTTQPFLFFVFTFYANYTIYTLVPNKWCLLPLCYSCLHMAVDKRLLPA